MYGQMNRNMRRSLAGAMDPTQMMRQAQMRQGVGMGGAAPTPGGGMGNPMMQPRPPQLGPAFGQMLTGQGQAPTGMPRPDTSGMVSAAQQAIRQMQGQPQGGGMGNPMMQMPMGMLGMGRSPNTPAGLVPGGLASNPEWQRQQGIGGSMMQGAPQMPMGMPPIMSPLQQAPMGQQAGAPNLQALMQMLHQQQQQRWQQQQQAMPVNKPAAAPTPAAPAANPNAWMEELAKFDPRWSPNYVG